MRISFDSPSFRKSFPFEGNRNALRVPTLHQHGSSESPSRLKGIETFPVFAAFNPFVGSESPSRLKGIETDKRNLFSVFRVSSESPSRLKGIETNIYRRGAVALVLLFRKSFPFEGNRNPLNANNINIIPCSESPSRLKGIETNTQLSQKELSPPWFRKSFPFEGNRNFINRSSHPGSSILCSESPSRLKGIETFIGDALKHKKILCSESPSRLKGIETLSVEAEGHRMFCLVQKVLPV